MPQGAETSRNLLNTHYKYITAISSWVKSPLFKVILELYFFIAQTKSTLITKIQNSHKFTKTGIYLLIHATFQHCWSFLVVTKYLFKFLRIHFNRLQIKTRQCTRIKIFTISEQMYPIASNAASFCEAVPSGLETFWTNTSMSSCKFTNYIFLLNKILGYASRFSRFGFWEVARFSLKRAIWTRWVLIPLPSCCVCCPSEPYAAPLKESYAAVTRYPYAVVKGTMASPPEPLLSSISLTTEDLQLINHFYVYLFLKQP